jgi:hypothetical protein
MVTTTYHPHPNAANGSLCEKPFRRNGTLIIPIKILELAHLPVFSKSKSRLRNARFEFQTLNEIFISYKMTFRLFPVVDEADDGLFFV